MHYTDSLSILSSEMGGPGYFAHIWMFAIVRGVGNTGVWDLIVLTTQSAEQVKVGSISKEPGDQALAAAVSGWAPASKTGKKDVLLRCGEAVESWDRNGLPSQQEPWSGRKLSVLATRYLATSTAPAHECPVLTFRQISANMKAGRDLIWIPLNEVVATLPLVTTKSRTGRNRCRPWKGLGERFFQTVPLTVVNTKATKRDRNHF